MNAEEAGSLGGGANDAEGLADFACTLLELGPRAVVITRGAAGSVADGPTRRLHQEAVTVAVEQGIDPTGCGDVFLAGLAAGLLMGNPLQQSLAIAATAAGRNCAYTGIDDLGRLTAA